MTKTIISLAILISLTLAPIALADFNPEYIISDAELTNKKSMHMGQIQDFLEQKNSYLATYVDPSNRILASQSIYNSANVYGINPKYILVLLQKEQSLITDPNPSQNQLDWATGYGICDNCSKADPKVQKYKGLSAQVDWGAGGTRYYYDHANEFKFQVGETFNISGRQVTIQNDATRALYTYTPHIQGNENFYHIWNNWFNTSFLEGSLLQDTVDGGIYLIRDGQKLPFLSKAAFLSRYNSFDHVIPADPAKLASYPTGTAIKYSNYSLLQINSGGIYLLDDDTLRPIVSEEAFRLLGFNPEEIVSVSTNDIFYYKLGKPIDETDAYPTGGLLQDNSTGGVYFVEAGVKYPIPTKDIMNLYYSDKKLTSVTPEELSNYETGSPAILQDGELVRTKEDPTVYVISNGNKRAFASDKDFEDLGYKFNNVVTLDTKTLKLHPTGDIVSVIR